MKQQRVRREQSSRDSNVVLLGAFAHPNTRRNVCAIRVCHVESARFVVVLYRGVRVLPLCEEHGEGVIRALMDTSVRQSLALELPPERVAGLELVLESDARTYWAELERDADRAVFDFVSAFGFAHAHRRRRARVS